MRCCGKLWRGGLHTTSFFPSTSKALFFANLDQRRQSCMHVAQVERHASTTVSKPNMTVTAAMPTAWMLETVSWCASAAMSLCVSMNAYLVPCSQGCQSLEAVAWRPKGRLDASALPSPVTGEAKSDASALPSQRFAHQTRVKAIRDRDNCVSDGEGEEPGDSFMITCVVWGFEAH